MSRDGDRADRVAIPVALAECCEHRHSERPSEPNWERLAALSFLTPTQTIELKASEARGSGGGRTARERAEGAGRLFLFTGASGAPPAT